MKPKSRVLLATFYLFCCYAFIFVARDVVLFLRDRNLLRLTVAVIGVLALAGLYKTIISQWRVSRKLAVQLVLGIGVFYGCALYYMERPEERFHYIQYGLLSPLIIYTAHGFSKKLSSLSYGLLAVLSMVLGAGDEVIQSFVPSRVFEWKDVFFNVSAAALGMFFYFLVRYFAKKESKKR
ncbi:MAG: VanZ family protein [Bdellovibrionota bacterium]